MSHNSNSDTVLRASKTTKITKNSKNCPQLQLDPALEASKMNGDEKFVFGLHPHGVLSDYRILLDGVTRQHFPKVSGAAIGVAVVAGRSSSPRRTADQ